jgi:aspartyl aminopeptidase
LRLLNEKYGITETDFLSAELSAVPALETRDQGLDRSFIAATDMTTASVPTPD